MKSIEITCNGKKKTIKVADQYVKKNSKGEYILNSEGRKHRTRICSVPSTKMCMKKCHAATDRRTKSGKQQSQRSSCGSSVSTGSSSSTRSNPDFVSSATSWF